MIQEFVDRFEANKLALRAKFKAKVPGNYEAVVKAVIEAVASEEDYSDFNPDPERIHQIDDGDYQGTMVFVIAAKGYQPSDYWSVFVRYGSCSGCDTLQSINESYGDVPTESELDQYVTLALHIVQGLKKMDERA